MDKYLNANIVLSKFSRDYMESKKDIPVRPSELAVLNIITRREGRFTPLMIKELLGVSKPMITAHINILEKNGYVKKDFTPSDKRSFFVVPTQKAEELVKRAEERTNERLKTIEGELGEEKFDELIKMLETARTKLK